jgi:hypothetical protein
LTRGNITLKNVYSKIVYAIICDQLQCVPSFGHIYIYIYIYIYIINFVGYSRKKRPKETKIIKMLVNLEGLYTYPSICLITVTVCIQEMRLIFDLNSR